MYKHSLFVATCDEATAAESYIPHLIQGVEDIYQSNDGESQNVEVRFFTEQKLDRYDRNALTDISHTSYAFNQEGV